ncbi:MAG: HEAT repeat domain-containing protein [Candidatus Micrarchaeia archaeon]
MTTEISKLMELGKKEELVKLGPEAVESIIPRLSSSYLHLKEYRIEALAEIAKTDEGGFQRLIKELVTNENWRVKAGCAEALGLIGDLRAVGALIEGLKDKDLDVREAYMKALVEIAKTDEGGFQKLIIKLGIGVVTDLIKELKYYHESAIKEYIIQTLAEIAKTDEKTFQILLKELETNESWWIKIDCAKALGLIGDPRAVGTLIEGLKDKDSDVRKACMKALVEIAKTDENTLELLIQTLKNTLGLNVKFHCAKALGQIGDPRAVGVLIEVLKDEDSDVSESCAKALENINDPRGLHFKKIIYNKSEDYALELGIEKTRATIKEYLELIKNHYSKERIGEIKVELYIFYRKVFEKATDLKPCMDLPKLEIKPLKRGPEIYAKLMGIGL